MEQNMTWLLIADASKAKLYAMHKAKFLVENHPRHLNLIGSYTHDDSRKKNSELVTDSSPADSKQNEAKRFAHQLIGELDMGRKDGHYRDLILVAPPHFMGLLHTGMTPQLQKMVAQTIEKEYTHLSDMELVNSLIKHF